MPEQAEPAADDGGYREEVVVTSWKAYPKNTLVGFLDLTLPSGLVIRNICLHERDAQRWISMPARPYRHADGTDAWQPLVGFVDARSRVDFQVAALAAIDDYFAGDNNGE